MKLQDYGKNRRTITRTNPKGYSPSQIVKIIHRREWPYKTDEGFYHKRDLALASLMYLTSGRINEVLRVTRDQIVQDEDDPDFMVVRDFWVSKRKTGKTHPILEIPLPLVGKLSSFTRMVLEYLDAMTVHRPKEKKLFKFGRARAWAIIRYITKDPTTKELGVWNHWFRAQSLSYQIEVIRSTISVAKQRGIENPNTLAIYDRSDWKTYKDALRK